MAERRYTDPTSGETFIFEPRPPSKIGQTMNRLTTSLGRNALQIILDIVDLKGMAASMFAASTAEEVTAEAKAERDQAAAEIANYIDGFDVSTLQAALRDVLTQLDYSTCLVFVQGATHRTSAGVVTRLDTEAAIDRVFTGRYGLFLRCVYEGLLAENVLDFLSQAGLSQGLLSKLTASLTPSETDDASGS